MLTRFQPHSAPNTAFAKIRVFAVILATIFGSWSQMASAQTDEGRITGIVRDASGGVVPGTTVVATNEQTGDSRETVTNTEGRYVFLGLRPALYNVKAQLSGFAKAEMKAQKVSAGQEVSLDIALKTASLAETIEVIGEGSALDSSSARQGANVSEREVSQLPVNGRQISQLYLQAPGAVNTGTGTFGDIRFSGRAVEQNIIRYDGIEGSAIIDASPGNLNGEVPSPFRLQASLENVQEFRVESSNFPAEYGTGTGGQITVITKSGTNAFHGGAFEYFRDQKLDSPNAFDSIINGKQAKSPLRQHQFGASIGGPLVKDKAFFFFSYEGYRLDSGINFVEAVPSAAARARAVPAIVPLIDAFKAPGAIILPGASANADFDIAQLQTLATVRENSFAGRLDVKLNPSNRLYLRYFNDKGDNDAPEGVTGRHVAIQSKPQNGVFALQSNLGSSTINEAKIGYNRADTQINGIAPTVNGIDLSAITINITGSVANSGIAGQGSTSGTAIPGGLVRQNSATNGRGAPYRPYS
ncbi:MAG: carboxypeptidase-like regulatory domain-containing protein, partial [Vicinamibacteria bacterium]